MESDADRLACRFAAGTDFIVQHRESSKKRKFNTRTETLLSPCYGLHVHLHIVSVCLPNVRAHNIYFNVLHGSVGGQVSGCTSNKMILSKISPGVQLYASAS